MENNFDKHIKEQLERAEAAPSKDLWAKLEGKLDAFEKPIEVPASSNKLFWNYGIAAAVTSVAAVLSFLFWNNGTAIHGVPQAKLPAQKANIVIGEEMKPTVEVVTVAAIAPATQSAAKTVKRTPVKVETKIESEPLLAESSDAKHTDEEFQIPVYSLKLNAKKLSPSLNERITIISGEPKNVEVDETLNQKQVLIHQRLQLINKNKHPIAIYPSKE